MFPFFERCKRILYKSRKIRRYKNMKKMNAQYNKLSDLMKTIKDIISDLGEKIGDIHDNAWNEDRDITDRENEICDEIAEQIGDLEDCVEHIENAMDCLGDYID